MPTQFRNNSLLVVCFLASLVVFGQSRVDDFNVADVQVTEVVLTPSPDGGCFARWGGVVNSADGGAQLAAVTEAVELRAALNQSRCTGLAAAGANRVGRALRFAVDAGAP